MSRLIDADALLEQIGIDSDGSPGYYGDTWQFIKTIENAPTLDMTSEWIPCSERLPSESGRYLCTYAEIQCGEYISCVDFGSFINGEWYTSGVIAWMPLPKPYGEREDQ